MTEFNGRIGHLEGIESPWGNAGGVVKTIDDVHGMAHTGVGWIEAGSYTLERRLGNAWNPQTQQFDKKVYHYDEETGITSNSLGIPNDGMDEVESEVPEMVRIAQAYDKQLVVNVAPVSEEPVEESVELVLRAYAAGADAVLLNAGCPNIVTEDGERHELLSRNPSGMFKVLQRLSAVNLPKPIWVRISPQESYARTSIICRGIAASGIVSAIVDPNTWPNYCPTDKNGEQILQVPGGTGGKSGPAMKREATMETMWAVTALRNLSVDVISSSAITNGQELGRRLDLGAAGGAGTTFYYESQNGWKEDTDRLLSELAA